MPKKIILSAYCKNGFILKSIFTGTNVASAKALFKTQISTYNNSLNN